MTVDEVQKIFSSGKLKLGNKHYWFDGRSNYTLAIGENSPEGTYEFITQGKQIYLRTNPPIVEGKKDLEVTLCLDTVPILFET